RGSSKSRFPTVCIGLSSRTGRWSSPTSPTVSAPTSPGSWPGTRLGSSWRPATGREGEFERFGDEGTAVGQEDVSQLQGDQAQRSGPRDLLQDAQAQTEARMMKVEDRGPREIEDFVGWSAPGLGE